MSLLSIEILPHMTTSYVCLLENVNINKISVLIHSLYQVLRSSCQFHRWCKTDCNTVTTEFINPLLEEKQTTNLTYNLRTKFHGSPQTSCYQYAGKNKNTLTDNRKRWGGRIREVTVYKYIFKYTNYYESATVSCFI